MQTFLCRSKNLFPRIKKKTKKNQNTNKTKQKSLTCLKQRGPALKISYRSDESCAPTDCASSAPRPSPAFPARSRSAHCGSRTTRAARRSATTDTHFARVPSRNASSTTPRWCPASLNEGGTAGLGEQAQHLTPVLIHHPWLAEKEGSFVLDAGPI